MNNLVGGSFRLFRIAGIQVYLHWSWLVVAYIEIVNRVNKYESMAWNVIEYLALFGIVLMHEFGHALGLPAGGRAGRSDHALAAGRRRLRAAAASTRRPVMEYRRGTAGQCDSWCRLLSGRSWSQPVPIGRTNIRTSRTFCFPSPSSIWRCLIFNLLPIYPLDGGQILQALLWFVIGRARSLMVSGIIGLAAAAGVIVLALVRLQDTWLALVAAFVAWQAWRGFRFGVTLQGLQPTLDLMSEGLSAVRSRRLRRCGWDDLPR